MPATASGPRVLVPPPFVFVAGWVAGWLLARVRPFEIDGAGASETQSVLGLLLMASGVALMAWGAWTFAAARTPIVPIRPARLVVAGGPYRFTRNPMYLGFTVVYVGLSAVLNQVWPLILLPVVLIALSAFVIAREETHLRAKFGSEYDDYCRRVRRWL